MKRYTLYGLPVVLLALFLFRVPFPVPAVLLARKVFIAQDRSLDAATVFSYLSRYSRIYLLKNGSIRELRSKDFTTTTSLAAVLEELSDGEALPLESYEALSLIHI